MSRVGSAQGKLPASWRSGQAEVDKDPRKMTQVMEVCILGRRQSILGRARIAKKLTGNAQEQGAVFQLPQQPGTLPRFPMVDH